MCLLTFMPAGVTISYEHARKAAINNPDGFGFAIHVGNAIMTDHDMNFERLWTRFTDARAVQKGCALLHFRIATHGDVTTDNCHPFYVGDDQQSVLAHNGMLPLTMPVNDGRSDTRLFAEIVLPHCGGVERLDDEVFFAELEAWSSGSKMVVMTIRPDVKYDWYIINEADGKWDSDGVWYSNTSYKSYTYTYARASAYGYGAGWSDDYGWDKYKSSAPVTPSGSSNYELSFYDDDDDLITDDQQVIYDADILTYLTDELYETDDWVVQILGFTTVQDWDAAMTECLNCGAITLVDPTEPSHTHCGHCKGCLVCTETGLCKCWDKYEYHQSYTPVLETKEAF